MNMNDMVIISVDDHISEGPDIFKNHLSGEDLRTAPALSNFISGAVLRSSPDRWFLKISGPSLI